MPFYEYDAVLYEEAKLKTDLSKKLNIPLTGGKVNNAEFMNNRFPKEILRKLRLTFLSSKTLLENGGISFI